MVHRAKRWVGWTAVGGGVLAAAVVARRARRSRPEPAARDQVVASPELEGQEIDLVTPDGADLAVTVVGPEDAPVVILPHCWGGSRLTWAPVSRRLVDAGCRVVRWDQRGHGRSSSGLKGHTVEGLADDLATVITGLDLHDVVLAGHSMGGMTIQAFATYHHDLFHERTRGVVLVSTAGFGLANPLSARMPALLRLDVVERLLANPATGRMLVRPTFGRAAHPHHVEATRADFVSTDRSVRVEFLVNLQAMDLRDGVARIEVPTTVMVGSRDTLTPVPLSRALAARISGSTLQVLVGLGHMLPYEAPDQVAAAVLARVGAAAVAPSNPPDPVLTGQSPR